jgi:MFS family permease
MSATAQAQPRPLRGQIAAHSSAFVYALFFIAGLGQSAIVPLLPRLASTFVLSPSETALLLALPGLATLIVSMPAGYVAHRFGARRVTLAAGVLICLSCLAQGVPALLVLVLGRLAFGIAFGVVWTSGMAWLSELRPTAESRRLGAPVTSSAVGVMVGPALAGLLSQGALVGAPFLLIGAFSVAVVVPLALSSGPGRRARGAPADPDALPPPKPPRGGPGLGIRGLLRCPGVLAGGGGLVVSGSISGVCQLLITLALHRDGVSTAGIGMAFAAAALVYIATSAVVVHAGGRANTMRLNALATLMLPLALVPALTGGGPLVLVTVLLLASPPRATVATIAYSLASGHAQDEPGADSMAFAMLNGTWAAAQVLTPVIAGTLDQNAGIDVALATIIIPCLGIAGWLLGGTVYDPVQDSLV